MGFGEGLSGFEDEEVGDVVAVGLDEGVPFREECGASGGTKFSIGKEGGLRAFDRVRDVGGGADWKAGPGEGGAWVCVDGMIS